MKKTATVLAKTVSSATGSAANEAQLSHEIENALEKACARLDIPWTPYSLGRTVRGKGTKPKFVDVAHGAVVIEYEPPKCFGGAVGAKLDHARKQAAEYAELLEYEEGRPLPEYVLVAWDGAHINFGHFHGGKPVWESLRPFDHTAAIRLLDELEKNGTPLVHPKLLAALVGPDSPYGIVLIPLFFSAIQKAKAGKRSTKTKLLFTEWGRLFGQVVGVQSDNLKNYLSQQQAAHGRDYLSDPAAYLFALNTYIALLAKLVAACALPKASANMLDTTVPIANRIADLETGGLFESAGISNMLNGDFFSWYQDDIHWPRFEKPIAEMVSRLSGVSFQVSKKSPESTRDLFKGIYLTFVPSALRHALGEFYTPDWLAEHALDVLGWKPQNDLIDPTCGTGTFLLDALRRRLEKAKRASKASDLLRGIHGIDLNPLAVLAAKGSLVVYLAHRLKPSDPIRLPVYLADAINPASLDASGCYKHTLQTELGHKDFEVPQRLIQHEEFFQVFARIRQLVDADEGGAAIEAVVMREFGSISLNPAERTALRKTIGTLVDLHAKGWNGIWSSILAERFAAGAIPPVRFICGNPPWVKWSHLPPDYAKFIKPRCEKMGVFGSDRWVGGIESDISTVITYEAIDKYLAPKGVLGFFITGSVFTNESSEGFRQFSIDGGRLRCKVELVEDFSAIKPFDGVSNHPTFLMVRRDASNTFPVTYRIWEARDSMGKIIRSFANAKAFLRVATKRDMLATPVPGGGQARPWLTGTKAQHKTFVKVFSSTAPNYRARKGVTPDRNGIYWVNVVGDRGRGLVEIENQPDTGKTKGIPQRRGIIEGKNLFPLLRGEGVSPFCATPEASLRIIVPQRGMHGDPKLPIHSIHTYKYLNRFKSELEKRSSLRRYQPGQPFYSLWSTGSYTFSPYKVVWREISGRQFYAAYIGSVITPVLGKRLVIPGHKVYFIPAKTEVEAAYLTGFLNAKTVAESVSAYAAQLSLGASVAEYLHIPKYDSKNRQHRRLAEIAKNITKRKGRLIAGESVELDQIAKKILGVK